MSKNIFYVNLSRKNVKMSMLCTPVKSSISLSACLTKCKNACATEIEEMHSVKMFQVEGWLIDLKSRL